MVAREFEPLSASRVLAGTRHLLRWIDDDEARSGVWSGVFRPLARPEGIAEHGRVTLTVTAEDHPASLGDLAGRISADDAQEMCAIVEREFELVDLRESQ